MLTPKRSVLTVLRHTCTVAHTVHGKEAFAAHPTVALAVVRVLTPPSQVVRVGVVAKKGVVQGANSLGTGGSTCSSNKARRASFETLLRAAPAHA